MITLGWGNGFQQPLLEDVHCGKMQAGLDRNAKETETKASVAHFYKDILQAFYIQAPHRFPIAMITIKCPCDSTPDISKPNSLFPDKLPPCMLSTVFR